MRSRGDTVKAIAAIAGFLSVSLLALFVLSGTVSSYDASAKSVGETLQTDFLVADSIELEATVGDTPEQLANPAEESVVELNEWTYTRQIPTSIGF